MNNSNKDKGFFKLKGDLIPILCTFFIVILMVVLIIEVAIKPFVRSTFTASQTTTFQSQSGTPRTITPYEDLMLYLSELEKRPRLYNINMRKIDLPVTYATEEKAAAEVIKFYNNIYSREHESQLQVQEKLIDLKIHMIKHYMEQEKCVAPVLNQSASSPTK